MKLITRLIAAHHIRQARRRKARQVCANRDYIRKGLGHV